jgi:hypothetical protein
VWPRTSSHVFANSSRVLSYFFPGRCIEYWTRDIRITPVYLPTGVSDCLLVNQSPIITVLGPALRLRRCWSFLLLRRVFAEIRTVLHGNLIEWLPPARAQVTCDQIDRKEFLAWSYLLQLLGETT